MPAANGSLRDTADSQAPAAAMPVGDAASAPHAEGAETSATLSAGDAADAAGPGSANDGNTDGGEVMEGLGGLFDETGAIRNHPTALEQAHVDTQSAVATSSPMQRTGSSEVSGGTSGQWCPVREALRLMRISLVTVLAMSCVLRRRQRRLRPRGSGGAARVGGLHVDRERRACSR